jgi:hypothetical protein
MKVIAMTSTQPRRSLTRWVYLLTLVAAAALALAACSTAGSTAGAPVAKSSTPAAAATSSSTAASTSAQGAAGTARAGSSLTKQLAQLSAAQPPAKTVKLAVDKPAGSQTKVGAAKFTRGFNIWNLTGAPITLASVTGASPDGQPPAGDVVQPGGYDHYEITWQFLSDQITTVQYRWCQGFYCEANMKVIGLDGGVYTTCKLYLEQHGLCSAGGAANSTIAFLDPPGTVRDIPPSQGQSQKDALAWLCEQTTAATCKFTLTGEQQTFGAPALVGAVSPNDTSENTDVDDECEYTAGIADTWGGEVTVGLEKIVTAEVTASYHHEVTNETTFKHRVSYTIKPTEVGWATIAWPVYRETGNFTITMGHTTWHLNGVHFDIPYTDSAHVPTWTPHTAPKGDPSIPPHAKAAAAAPAACTPVAAAR